MIVTFCGYREILSDKNEIREKLVKEVEYLINKGAKEFLLGGYSDFDYMCAGVVKELKQKYPHIKSILVKPYLTTPFDKWLYDESEYPPIENTPKKFEIIKRNEYMVDCADILISYVKYETSGASTTLKYATKKNKTIINIAQW